MGSNTYLKVANDLLASTGFQMVKRFVLKNSIYKQSSMKELRHMCKSIVINAPNLKYLNKLTLSRLSLDSECLIHLSQAVAFLPYLEHFDISANNFDRNSLTVFMTKICENNILRSLNIAYNSI